MAKVIHSGGTVTINGTDVGTTSWSATTTMPMWGAWPSSTSTGSTRSEKPGYMSAPHKLFNDVGKDLFVIRWGWPRWGPAARLRWLTRLRDHCLATAAEIDHLIGCDHPPRQRGWGER